MSTAAEPQSVHTGCTRRTLSLLLALSVLLVIDTAHASSEAVATVSSVNGTVTVKKPGREKAVPASRGEDIAVGDTITVGRDSTARLTFSDGSFANILGPSSMRINQYTLEPDTNRRTAQIRVMQGRARFVLSPDPGRGSRFIVDAGTAEITPGLACDFGVQVRDAETEVAALSSSVVVKNVEQFVVGQVALGMNQKATVAANRPPTQPDTLRPEERKAYTRDIGRTR